MLCLVPLQNDVSVTSLRHQYKVLVADRPMTSLIPEHGKHCMSYSVNFSVLLQTEILSTATSKFCPVFYDGSMTV